MRHLHSPSPKVTATRRASPSRTAHNGQSVLTGPTCCVKADTSAGVVLYSPVGQASGGHMASIRSNSEGSGNDSNAAVVWPCASVTKGSGACWKPTTLRSQSFQVVEAPPMTQIARPS